MQNDGLAIRAFQGNVNSKEENNIRSHPEQFTLFRMAEFDDQSGVIEKEETPVPLIKALELVEEPKYTVNQLEIAFEKFLEKTK